MLFELDESGAGEFFGRSRSGVLPLAGLALVSESDP